MMAVQARGSTGARVARVAVLTPVVQQKSMRDIILTGQRRIDEVRKTTPKLFIEGDLLRVEISNYRYEEALLTDAGARIEYNEEKVQGGRSPAGIFRNLSEKDYKKSFNALEEARQGLVRENSEKSNETEKTLENVCGRLKTLELIFDNYHCYALH